MNAHSSSTLSNCFLFTDNASNQISEEHSQYENYFAEVAESAVEPLLSILGCSVANRFRNDASAVAELDENFLDEYFHSFGSNVVGEKLRTKLDTHGNTFPAPKILPPIACACHRKCHIKFPDKIRQMILDRYAELSVENRVHFLTSHVKKETPFHSVVMVCPEMSLSTYILIYFHYYRMNNRHNPSHVSITFRAYPVTLGFATLCS